jgi:hypothetical protein
MNQPTAKDVLQELSAARAERGDGAVLDRLKARQPAWDWSALLPTHTGVRLLSTVSDPARWPARANLPSGTAALRDAAGAACLVMADPWDERALQRAATALGQLPEPLAATADELARWQATSEPIATTATSTSNATARA